MPGKILETIIRETTNPTFFKYKQIILKKKKGGKRIITIPSDPLRQSQRRLLAIFNQFKIHPAAHGFVEGRSIVTHARLHVAKESILTLDIEDFFGSITTSHLEALFRANDIHEQTDIDLLIKLTTLDGKLPQGAPTSPVLSNAIAFEMDCELENLALKNNLIYSRYADDMVFSSAADLIHGDRINDIANITSKYGFRLNQSKTRISSRKKRQIVTGLVVNRKLNVKREYVRNTSAILHNILKNPFEAVSQIKRKSIFSSYHSYDRIYVGRNLPLSELNELIKIQSSEKMLINPTTIERKYRRFFGVQEQLFRLLLLLQAVNGRISFISSVIGEESSRVQKLRKQFREIEKVLFGNVSINWATKTLLLYKKVVHDCPQLLSLIKGK